MVLGPSTYLVDKWFRAAFMNASFVVAQAYIQLHTADPGASGTNAVATDNTRKAVTMAAPVITTGLVTISNSAQVQWTGLTAAQDASHYALFDALTTGNFLGSGLINANAYGIGDSLTFAVGDIDIALSCAS